jgi:hypothetical protein
MLLESWEDLKRFLESGAGFLESFHGINGKWGSIFGIRRKIYIRDCLTILNIN